MEKEKVHYYWFDLLRFLAALVVVLSHFRGAFFVEYGLLPESQQNPLVFIFYSVTRLANEAVIVFFVLSGFLVGGKSIDRLQHGIFDFKSYAIDRTVRIMLPLIGALLFAIPVYTLNGTGINWIDWFGNLFSLQGILVPPVIEPLWSLSYEVWFYILIGALCYFFSQNTSSKGKYIVFVLLLVCALVFVKLKVIYLFIWALGAFAYFLIPKKKNSFGFWMSAGTGLILIALLQLSSKSRIETNIVIKEELLLLLFAFTFAVFIIFLVKIVPVTKWSLALNKFSTPLANFSYSLYLTHVLVLRTLQHYGFPKSPSISMQSLGLYVLEILIALIFSYIVYWLFEKRTDYVKKKLKDLISDRY